MKFQLIIVWFSVKVYMVNITLRYLVSVRFIHTLIQFQMCQSDRLNFGFIKIELIYD